MTLKFVNNSLIGDSVNVTCQLIAWLYDVLHVDNKISCFFKLFSLPKFFAREKDSELAPQVISNEKKWLCSLRNRMNSYLKFKNV